MSLERSNEVHHFQPIALIAGIAFSVSLLLTSCGSIDIEPTPTLQAPNETALAFETIEQKDWAGTGQDYEAVEPGLMIISSQKDIAYLPVGSDEAIGKLQDLDYKNFFALIVFQGRKDSGGYDVQIERITLTGNTVNVYAQFHEPEPPTIVTTEITSPYHLVKIQKSGEWDQEFLFQVIVDGTIVVSLNYFVP